MALNTNIGPGLLSSRTFRYGYNQENSYAFVLNTGTIAADDRGDYLSLTKYNFETKSYDTENYIFCMTGGSNPYTGSSGDVVEVGETVGDSRNSIVKGIAVTFSGASETMENLTTNLNTAFSSFNGRISWEGVTSPASTIFSVETGDRQEDNTIIFYYNWNALGPASSSTASMFPFVGLSGPESGFGSIGFTAGTLNGPLDTYEDKLIKLGRIVNAAGLTKSALTNINNDTELDTPDASVPPASPTQQTKARVMAIASYAYKKKKK